jgi:mannose-6-phosphate isomerase-like protein (cupin superfamily)
MSVPPLVVPVPDTLLPYVRSLAEEPDLWRPHVRFDRASRQWSRLPSRGDVDVWLLTWLPDQRTELHDHGDASAALTVVQGHLTEVRADPSGLLTAVDVRAGDASWVAPGVVHDVVNRSAEPAVSIHAYAPRLTRMTFWRRAGGTLVPGRTVLTDQPEAAA